MTTLPVLYNTFAPKDDTNCLVRQGIHSHTRCDFSFDGVRILVTPQTSSVGPNVLAHGTRKQLPAIFRGPLMAGEIWQQKAKTFHPLVAGPISMRNRLRRITIRASTSRPP